MLKGVSIKKNVQLTSYVGFPGGSALENLPANVGDVGLIPGLGISSGEGNGSPLQYSCLGNPIDRGIWWLIVHGVEKSQTQVSAQAGTEARGRPAQLLRA